MRDGYLFEHGRVCECGRRGMCAASAPGRFHRDPAGDRVFGPKGGVGAEDVAEVQEVTARKQGKFGTSMAASLFFEASDEESSDESSSDGMGSDADLI